MPSLEEIILRLAVILPALTLHEFAHAYSADRLGDPTPRMHGRLTLNPLAHIDPIGTIIVPIFLGFGWAKPVPINPMNFRDPARGCLITSAAGPLSNLLQAVVVGLVLRVIIAFGSPSWAEGSLVVYMLTWLTAVNLMLAFFNLIPLGPLDGHYVLEYFLPYPQKLKYQQFNRYGFLIVLGIIFLAPGVLFTVVINPAVKIATILSGVSPWQ